MDIRSIRYFLEVARELNITRAAENLHMAQPPLSRQIQLLEEELEVQLFDREKRHLQLTEEGMILFHRGEQILDLMEKTEAEIREFSHGVSGELFIGSVEGRGPHLLSCWIAEFKEKYPKVQYNLWNGSSDDAIFRLSKGLCDLALIVEPFDHEQYESIPVSSEPWAAMCPASHPLAKQWGKEVDLKQLVGYPLIIPSRKSRTQEIHGWFEQIGQEPTIVCELSHYLNAFELVKQGVGIAIFPSSIGMNLESSEVVMKKIVNPEHIANYVLVWDKQRKLPTAAEKFVEYVRDEWKEN
jgi:DNA-binding transcriptional LysR family regulator